MVCLGHNKEANVAALAEPQGSVALKEEGGIFPRALGSHGRIWSRGDWDFWDVL